MTWPCPVQPGVGHFDPSAKVMGERERINFLCSTSNTGRSCGFVVSEKWIDQSELSWRVSVITLAGWDG